MPIRPHFTNTPDMAAVRINNPRSHQFKYDVVFSFAEEDRPFVEGVAAALKEEKVKLYYDDHERIHIWGKDLSDHLDKVYRSEARFCVMFISKYYKEKRWTRHEQEWAKARAFFEQNKEYILPFRLDDTELPGIKDTIAYLSRANYDEAGLARAIMQKISREQKRKVLLWVVALLLSILALSGISIAIREPPAPVIAVKPVVNTVTGKKGWHFRSICRDGWLSHSSGRGTCSSHHGVAHPLDTVIYGESEAACREAYLKTHPLHDQ